MQASYDQYMPYLFSRAGAAGVPLAGTFELTCRCNFDCRMCYIHRSQFDASARAAERDAAWWLALARSARDAGMLTLLLTGGEPLLRPDFPEIYTACRNLGLLVSVNTNGTLLTPELVQLLAQTPPQRINLTLYGASRETYAALCGRPEAYDRVLWTIDALQAAGVPLKLNFTETPYNQADAPAVYAFARARGLRVDAVTYCFPPVRARENGACTSERFSPGVSAREQVRYDRFRFGEEGFRARARALLDGQTPPPADACQELPTEKIRCRAGLSTFWVTWDGQLRPCGMMCTPSVPVGDDFAAAWSAIRAARERILLPAKCTACPDRAACDLCPAVAYAEHADFTAVPEYLCARTAEYLAICQKALADPAVESDNSGKNGTIS